MISFYKLNFMNVLLTGTNGFIGYNLAKTLIETGYNVITFKSRYPICNKNLNLSYINSHWNECDLSEINKIDLLIHHSSITDTFFDDKNLMFKSNVSDAISLFREALNKSCKKIIYASSMQVYGNAKIPFTENSYNNPLNYYALSKLYLEEEVKQIANEFKDVSFIGLRYGNVYGPSESHKNRMASMVRQIGCQMIKSSPKLYKYGEQKRDFIYITDVIDAIISSFQINESIILNIGSGVGISFNRIVELFNFAFNLNRKPIYIDNPFYDKYQNDVILDISLAKRKIGFFPKISIEEGIKHYISSGEII